jgi:UDP-N-acetylglucosamine--N-acetylmuramyl-(pentapeptide) pyrophosphoryl-undecaprenol N-acetylglucosamine transferase|tara:strand:+ start:826 stop:1944 length:1119 start_codon:yes stop_codon:yes gene_type:complete
LAAGGTGGHIFPAQALAMELLVRGYSLVLVADSRSEAFDGALGELEIHRIDAAGIAGRGYMAKSIAFLRLGRGYLQARRLLRRLDPLVVVGFGSYPSAPTVLAAQHIGQKTVIHEQNAVLGRANRMLAPRATGIATAFESVSALRAIDRDKAVWTGNPVRPEIVAVRECAYCAPDNDNTVNIMVLGGSQGAKVLGEVVPQALADLPLKIRVRLNVLQQCRADEVTAAREIFKNAGIKAEVSVFFDDIPARLASAALVICRSGASTIAELTTVGRPAILVPFSHATDDHQTANAEGLSDAGGGWIIQQDGLTAALLSRRLAALLSPSPTLNNAAKCAAKMGKPEAAGNLADLVVSTMGDDKDGVSFSPTEAAA